MNIQALKQRFSIIGRSEKLHRVLSIASRVANTDLTVLIEGESGVGKEVFSKIIHQLSSRKHNTFIAINCGAIPEGTINSELFGHEKGAFTGATSDRKGYFETANGGTIFLDEIGEMPLDTQAYLLRVLESGEFIKVGSSSTQKTNVRIIAATNVSLEELIKKGKFREDLYYRLHTVPIKVPSLKNRREDIHMLFRKFANDFADKYNTSSIRLTEAALSLIENYPWPGNIRELKNVVEQLSILSEEKMIDELTLIETIPKIRERNLPAIRKNGASDTFKEREILYKLLFDMKGDLNDLKNLVFELISRNDLDMPDLKKLNQIKEATFTTDSVSRDFSYPNYSGTETQPKAVLIHDKPSVYQESEVVEENLSLEDMEKELIKKALKKHRNRRKDASKELGISERTLYRKIREYDI